jgi:hypothetical protein
MSRRHLLTIAFCVAAVVAFGAASAWAAGTRSQRSVSGVRATVSAYDNAALAGNGKAGCALLTSAAQKALARDNHVSSCDKAFELFGEVLKTTPKQAAALRSYAAKLKVTIHGNTATVPKLDEPGHVMLSYTHGLWYVNSSI